MNGGFALFLHPLLPAHHQRHEWDTTTPPLSPKWWNFVAPLLNPFGVTQETSVLRLVFLLKTE